MFFRFKFINNIYKTYTQQQIKTKYIMRKKIITNAGSGTSKNINTNNNLNYKMIENDIINNYFKI